MIIFICTRVDNFLRSRNIVSNVSSIFSEYTDNGYNWLVTNFSEFKA